MSWELPLFPLGTVLFPGLVLPLHIFEDRYRQLIAELLAGPQPRQFGVIAIRKGRESGIDGISALYDIGCTATLQHVTMHQNGTSDVLSVGAQRFALAGLDYSRPYLTGQVDLLPDEIGDAAAARQAAAAVRGAFGSYLEALSGRGGTRVSVPELPQEPVALSYLIATSMIIEVSERQALLAEPDAAARLAAERSLLSAHTSMLRSLTSMPAPDLRYSPYNPN